MSTRKQQEEKFRKKRIAKHGSISVNQEKDLSPRKVKALGFDKFFALVNGWEKTIIAAALSLFLCIPIARYYSQSTTLMLVILVGAAFFVFPLAVYLYLTAYYKSYVRFVQGGTHSISGWNNVVGSLSEDFWKGKTIAGIKIEVKPADSSLPEERKRLFEFINGFANEGSKRLPHARLAHFTLDLQFVVGKQSAFVIKKIFDELAAVMNRNRAGQSAIEISFTGEVPKPETTDNGPRLDQQIRDEIREQKAWERYMKG